MQIRSTAYSTECRAVGRSENPGVPVLFDGHNLPPLVEIGLTHLPKIWGGGTPRDDRPVIAISHMNIFTTRKA